MVQRDILLSMMRINGGCSRRSKRAGTYDGHDDDDDDSDDDDDDDDGHDDDNDNDGNFSFHPCTYLSTTRIISFFFFSTTIYLSIYLLISISCCFHRYYFHEDYWGSTSQEAIDLIRKMLCVDQSKVCM